MAKLLSASSVSAMMTTATGRLLPSPSVRLTALQSGRCSAGSPGSTAPRHATPCPGRSNSTVASAPSPITTMAMGNLGLSRLAASRITSAAAPSPRDRGWTCTPARCRTSSGSSPVPAVPPMSLGSCIRMMVQQIPLINPPITEVDTNRSTRPARSRANSSSHTPT